MAAKRLKSWSSGPNTSDGRRMTALGKLLQHGRLAGRLGAAVAGVQDLRSAPMAETCTKVLAPASRAALAAARAPATCTAWKVWAPRLRPGCRPGSPPRRRLRPRGAPNRDSAGWPAPAWIWPTSPIGCRWPARSGRRTAARTRQPSRGQRPHRVAADEARAAEDGDQAALLQPRDHRQTLPCPQSPLGPCISRARGPCEGARRPKGDREGCANARTIDKPEAGPN